METRMERYAKYRSEIRRMSDRDFAAEQPSRASTPEQAAKYVYDQVQSSPIATANDEFLRRRKRIFIAKVVVGILLFVGLLVWGVLLFGRVIA